MRQLLLLAAVAGCSEPPTKPDTTTRPEPSPTQSPTLPTEDTTTPTSSTTTTSTTDTTTPTTSTTGCGTPDPLAPFSGDCAEIDQAALDACTCGGFAALLDGQGFLTIADAVAASVDAQMIKVCPGTWDESVTLADGRQLVAVDPTPGATVLQASGRVSGVSVVGGAELVGLTLTGASSTALHHDGGDLSLACAVVTGNGTPGQLLPSGYVPVAGGVSSFNGGEVSMSETVLENNFGAAAGGAYVFGDAVSVVVEGCTFESNGSDWNGGALTLDHSGDVEIRDSSFTANTAIYGGAVFVAGRGQDVQLIGDLFTDNLATQSGAALYVQQFGSDTLLVQGSTLEGNTAALTGGGLALWTFYAVVDVHIEDSAFRANQADTGAAISLVPTLAPSGLLELTLTEFTDNVANWGGSVVAALTAGPMSLVGTDLTVLRNSSGPEGAALWLEDQTLDCVGCDFGSDADDNSPVDAIVGGILYESLELDFTL